MAPAADKGPNAFRTIGELAQEIGRPQHILRYWETRFPQLKPLQRAGGRRYYRPSDVLLVRRIDSLLAQDGYTIRGVQRLLAGETVGRCASERAGSIQQVRDGLIQALRDDVMRD